MDGYFEEKNGSKCLIFNSADKNKKVLKKFTKLWNGIENEIETINGSKEGKYGKDFMKIKFDSDDSLPLNKTLKFDNMIIVIRSAFEEDGKFNPQIYLDECLYELEMLEYHRIGISDGIDINKTNASKEFKICHYWYFKDIGFKYESYLCNGCHDLMQKAISFNDVAIVYVKGSAYRIHFWYTSKDNAISIMNKSNLIDKMGVLSFFITIYKKWVTQLIVKETEIWY